METGKTRRAAPPAETLRRPANQKRRIVNGELTPPDFPRKLRAMPISWNEIRHNAIKFSREWKEATSESAGEDLGNFLE